MGRSPFCDENGLKKGPWTPEEDEKLVYYITKNGHGCWRTLPKKAGLKRCGKSCRLRWTNYLKPDIKRGKFSQDEERIIINLHSVLGNKWSKIATHLPGRTDNEIKNNWNTCLRKKLLQMGIDPNTHKPRTDLNHLLSISQLIGTASQIGNSIMSPWDNALKLQADIAQLATLQLFQNLLQFINTTTTPLPYIENNNTTSTNGLLGYPIFEGLANNSTNMSTMLNTQLDYQFQSLSGFVNGPINGTQANFPNSWAEDDHFGINHKKLKSDLGSSSFPQLVSAGTCKNNKTESNSNSDNPQNYMSTDSPDYTIFEAWEKLMDDETYWKDILELMS